MYHTIVRRRIRALFDAVNAGNAEPVLDAFSARFEHIFIGEHALSGRRTTIASTREWYERLYRLLPDLQFTIHRITVAGTPWNTIATVEWTETNSGTDGVRTTSAGIHVVHLRWGKMARLLIIPDTVPVTTTLARTEATSSGESLHPPIDDAPGWPRPW